MTEQIKSRTTTPEYSNAGDQAKTTALTIANRLQSNHFALSTDVRQALAAQGIEEHKLPMLSAVCVAVNVSPNLLRYMHNLPPIVRVMSLITDYGYRCGDDFYVSVFDTKVPIPNEFGEPTDQKAEAPTVVVMSSAARAIENMRNDDRMNGVIHHIEASVIEDRTEAKRIFDQHAGAKYVWHDEVMVAQAELYSYLRGGQPLGSGKPLTFYGFFLPYYCSTHNGKKEVKSDYNEIGKPKANYGPGDVAMKRAEVKAARHVTRINYARDTRPADVRLAAMVSRAETNLTIAEHKAAEFGVSVETALIEGESLQRPEHNTPVRHREHRREADGDILFAGDEEPPTDEELANVPPIPAPKPANGNATPRPGLITEGQRGTLNALGVALHPDKATWDAKRHAGASWASDKRTKSSAELWQSEADIFITELEKRVLAAYEALANELVAGSADFDVNDLVEIDQAHGVDLAKALSALRELQEKQPVAA